MTDTTATALGILKGEIQLPDNMTLQDVIVMGATYLEKPAFTRALIESDTLNVSYLEYLIGNLQAVIAEEKAKQA